MSCGGPPDGRTYWQASAPAWSLPPAEAPRRADVAVVGAGFTGLSAAYHLALAGASVAVFEAGEVGEGASGRNGGQVLPGYDRDYPELVERLGLARAQAMWRLSLSAIERMEAIMAREGIECGWEAYGHLEAATTAAQRDALARAGDALARDLQHPTRLLGPAEMEAAVGSPFYIAGLEFPTARAFHPLLYARGLAAAAARRGAVILQGRRVTAVHRRDGEYAVAWGEGRTSCREVIVATNAYVPPFAPWLRRRILPVTSTVVATAPLAPGYAARILPGRQTLSDLKTPMYYFRVTADARLVFGGGTGEEGRSLVRVFPYLEGTRIDYRWHGRVAVSADWLPHIGRTPEGWLYAAGYTGHGAAFSTEAGAMLAALALGEGTDDTATLGPFAALPFPPMALLGQHGRVARMVRAYLRLRERLAAYAHRPGG